MSASGGKLTTHVLDTAHGCPGKGIAIEVFRIEGERRQCIRQTRTNDDGRCDEPLLAGENFTVGVFELQFAIGDYFADRRVTAASTVSVVKQSRCGPPFLDRVVIRFGIAADNEHYHVPLLVSPYSYSTYRGS